MPKQKLLPELGLLLPILGLYYVPHLDLLLLLLLSILRLVLPHLALLLVTPRRPLSIHGLALSNLGVLLPELSLFLPRHHLLPRLGLLLSNLELLLPILGYFFFYPNVLILLSPLLKLDFWSSGNTKASPFAQPEVPSVKPEVSFAQPGIFLSKLMLSLPKQTLCPSWGLEVIMPSPGFYLVPYLGFLLPTLVFLQPRLGLYLVPYLGLCLPSLGLFHPWSILGLLVPRMGNPFAHLRFLLSTLGLPLPNLWLSPQ